MLEKGRRHLRDLMQYLTLHRKRECSDRKPLRTGKGVDDSRERDASEEGTNQSAGE